MDDAGLAQSAFRVRGTILTNFAGNGLLAMQKG